jgi:hypothetical protein
VCLSNIDTIKVKFPTGKKANPPVGEMKTCMINVRRVSGRKRAQQSCWGCWKTPCTPSLSLPQG